MAIITLKDWYQLDFVLPDVPQAKSTLLKIDELMAELRTKKLVPTWFFLFEGNTIRVRMESLHKNDLYVELQKLSQAKGLSLSDKLPFSDYQEDDEMMHNESFVESFAKIMCEVTKMTIEKLRGDTTFSNYRVLERLQHCMFNNLATLSFKSEENFLQQRLLERMRQSFDADFENKI